MAEYLTVNGTSSAEITEKRSRFIASVSFADSEEKALEFLASIKKLHTMANHNVYAYILREGVRMRSSDDGEPAKTAGLPVLDTIRHANITDCVIVVTRYFGGTLLGTGGLVRAYSAAAKAGLNASRIVTISECVSVSLNVNYAFYEQAARLIEQHGAKALSPLFTDIVSLGFTVLAGHEAPLIQALSELTHGDAHCTVSPVFFAAF